MRYNWLIRNTCLGKLNFQFLALKISYGENTLIFYNGDIPNKLVLRYHVNDVITVLTLVSCPAGLTDTRVFSRVLLACASIVTRDGGAAC